MAKKYKIKTAFQAAFCFMAAAEHQAQKGIVDRARWFTPAEALAMATSTSRELLALSGLRNHIPASWASSNGCLADLLSSALDPWKTSISLLTGEQVPDHRRDGVV